MLIQEGRRGGRTKGPEQLHQKYNGIATEPEVVAFWKIRPSIESKNVIAIRAEKLALSNPKKDAKKKSTR
jgi:hypothetical protein